MPEDNTTELAKDNTNDNQNNNAFKFDLILKCLSALGSVGLFLLSTGYILGYVIWSSYLGKYGIHSQDFFRSDFLSAALCYVLFLLVLATPTTYLFAYLYLDKLDIGKLSWGLLIFWWYLLQRFTSFFNISPRDFVLYPINFYSVLLFVALVHILLSFFRKRFKNEKTKKVIFDFAWVWVYNLALIINTIFEASNINVSFVVSCLSLGSVFFYFTLSPKETWKNHKMILSVIVGLCFFLLILQNASSFGINQFGLIEQQKGGGKPKIAKVYPNQNGKKIFNSISIAIDTLGWSQPLLILANGDRELYFVTPHSTTNTAKSVRLSFIDGVEYIPDSTNNK